MTRARKPLLLFATTAAVAWLGAFGVRPHVHADPSDEADIRAGNRIDRFILERLNAEHVQPSPLCSDEEFCRRVYLDICGVIPTLEQAKAFLAGRDPHKRDKLIDKLLASPRYAEHWAVMWSDLLRDNTNSKAYRDWIRRALRTNMPYSEFARELIAASGNVDDNPAARFIVRDQGNNVELVNTVSNVFMGTRMACAQCHDHPFDKWTQDDFHSLMAFFVRTNVQADSVATLERTEADPELSDEFRELLQPYFDDAHAAEFKTKQKNFVDPRDDGLNCAMLLDEPPLKNRDIAKELESRTTKENVDAIRKLLGKHDTRLVSERTAGEYRMPTEGDGIKKGAAADVVAAVFPWDPAKKSQGPGSRRRALAEFVTGSRRFAEVQVNRLWAQLTGRGWVEPRDDFREKNPPTHPELLEFLADEFIASNYDTKHMLKMMLSSETYQRSTLTNESNRGDTLLYSHSRVRRMTAEQIYDSILVATGYENDVEDDPDDAAIDPLAKVKPPRKGKIRWAADIPVPAQDGSFFNVLNQPSRDQTAAQREQNASMPQALELMNGRTLNDAVRNSVLAGVLLKSRYTPAVVLEDLYLATLSRTPTAREAEILIGKNQTVTRMWIDDVAWALLNSPEFSYVK